MEDLNGKVAINAYVNGLGPPGLLYELTADSPRSIAELSMRVQRRASADGTSNARYVEDPDATHQVHRGEEGPARGNKRDNGPHHGLGEPRNKSSTVGLPRTEKVSNISISAFTPLVATTQQILDDIEGNCGLRWPAKMKTDLDRRARGSTAGYTGIMAIPRMSVEI